MSALAVYFEREGIATVVVGLIRLHLEKIRPPRALWVPFELGRPLGAYTGQGEFQKSVLRHALSLFDSEGTAILEDYAEEDPGSLEDNSWRAPILPQGTLSLTEEVEHLKPQWQNAVQHLGRSMTGLSGLPLEQTADYLQRFDTDNPASNPDDQFSDLLRLRFCADDIKAFYAEAALLEGSPSSRQIGDWFWNSTRAAETLWRIRNNNMNHENSTRATVCGRLLIPGAYLT